jgi:hypothetical protein
MRSLPVAAKGVASEYVRAYRVGFWTFSPRSYLFQKDFRSVGGHLFFGKSAELALGIDENHAIIGVGSGPVVTLVVAGPRQNPGRVSPPPYGKDGGPEAGEPSRRRMTRVCLALQAAVRRARSRPPTATEPPTPSTTISNHPTPTATVWHSTLGWRVNGTSAVAVSLGKVAGSIPGWGTIDGKRAIHPAKTPSRKGEGFTSERMGDR